MTVKLTEEVVFEVMKEHLDDLIEWDAGAALRVAKYVAQDIQQVDRRTLESKRFKIFLGDLFFFQLWKMGKGRRS
jgi:hypothetical protein